MQLQTVLKTGLLLGCVWLLAVAGVSCRKSSARVHPTEAILDLQSADDGGLADRGPLKRELNPAKTAQADGGVAIQGEPSVVIGFNAQDPLFDRGPFTWLMRCKLRNPAGGADRAVIFGRADPAGGQLVSGLQLRQSAVAGRRSLALLVSGDGSAEAADAAVLGQPLPANMWVTVAAVYDPPSSLSLFLISETGSVFQQKVETTGVPAQMSGSDTPLLLAAAPDAGLVVSRIRCWNYAYTIHEILGLAKK